MSVNRKVQPPRLEARTPSFHHLRRMTDDTGLIEHALGRIPRRREGYTTDDNARALWTATEWLSFRDDAVRPEERSELLKMTDIYLAFMLWTQNDDGWWLNNFSYDRTLEPEEISHDCQGRSIWACADAWIRLEGAHRETARVIVERAIPTLHRIDSIRGQAFTMATCAHLLEASRDGRIMLKDEMKKELNQQLTRLETLLVHAFEHFSDPKWRWFEPAMTYSNGVLPWAMLRTYRYTERQKTLKTGLESLAYLIEVMTSEEGWLRPIGNEDWCNSESISRWDQQPLELFKLALALDEAALAVQGLNSQDAIHLVGSAKSMIRDLDRPDENHSIPWLKAGQSFNQEASSTDYIHLRNLCREWFYGANDLQVPVIDPEDGSCCDGLTQHGPNINCGAEATLSYLMTEALCQRDAPTTN